MPLYNHPDLEDIALSKFSKGEITSIPVNENLDRVEVTLESGEVLLCGVLYHPWWDLGERFDSTPKGSSGALREGDQVWVLRTPNETPKVIGSQGGGSKKRFAFTVQILNQLGEVDDPNDVDGLGGIDFFVYDYPDFNLIFSAVVVDPGPIYSTGSDGAPNAEFDSISLTYYVYIPNDFLVAQGASDFILTARASSEDTEVMYPESTRPDGGYTQEQIDNLASHIHPGRFDITLIPDVSFTITNFLVNACPEQTVAREDSSPTWDQIEVLVEFWVNKGEGETKDGVTDGATISGQLFYSLPGNPAPNGEEEDVEFTVDTFAGNAVEGEATVNSQLSSAEGAVYLTLTHDGPCTKTIPDGQGGFGEASASPSVSPAKIEGNRV